MGKNLVTCALMVIGLASFAYALSANFDFTAELLMLVAENR